MGAEVAGDGVTLPVRREVRAVNEFEAAELRPVAGRDALGLAPHVGVGEVGGAFHRVIDALEPGAVGEEGVSVLVPMMAPRVAAALGENFQSPGVRVESPDAPAVQPHDAMRRLYMRV